MQKITKDRIKDVYDLYKLEQDFKALKSKYEEKKKQLSNNIKEFMKKNNSDSFDFDGMNGKIIVKHVQPKKIIWKVDKLEESLDKDLCNEFIDKRYEIKDMANLVKYLKSCGVNPKRFKSFISVEKSVNEKKLDQLFNLGDIDKEDVEGCYEIKPISGHLKINLEKAK